MRECIIEIETNKIDKIGREREKSREGEKSATSTAQGTVFKMRCHLVWAARRPSA